MMTLLAVCSLLLAASVAVHSGSGSQTPLLKLDAACIACEGVLGLAIAGLGNNVTIANVGAELAHLCAVAPKPVAGACRTVEKVFVKVLDILPKTLAREDYTAYGLCTMLGECKVDCCVSDAPEQIKLTLTGVPNEIAVGWIARHTPSQPCVRYASPNAVPQLACGTASTYTVGGWLGSIQLVVLSGLLPRTDYQYAVGDNATGVWSAPLTFSNGPFLDEPAGRPFRLAVIGDMGETNVSDATIAHLLNLVQTDGFDVLLHDGDVSYADGLQFIFDEYGRKVQKLVAAKPILLTIGNHESVFFKGIPFRERFIAPIAGSPDPIFWSANLEVVHVVGMNSESAYDTAYVSDDQVKWLRADLAAVNRTQTPFVVVLLHRPLYCTSEINGSDCGMFANLLRQAVEMLFVDYQVDLVVQAHRHNYESTWPVQYGQRTRKGPVYVVNGSAGCRELIQGGFSPAPAWSRFRSLDYGYSVMEVNSTTLTWEFHRDSDNAVIDSFVLQK